MTNFLNISDAIDGQHSCIFTGDRVNLKQIRSVTGEVYYLSVTVIDTLALEIGHRPLNEVNQIPILRQKISEQESRLKQVCRDNVKHVGDLVAVLDKHLTDSALIRTNVLAEIFDDATAKNVKDMFGGADDVPVVEKKVSKPRKPRSVEPVVEAVAEPVVETAPVKIEEPETVTEPVTETSLVEEFASLIGEPVTEPETITITPATPDLNES